MAGIRVPCKETATAFGTFLRRERLKRGISLQQFATLMGPKWQASRVCKYERFDVDPTLSLVKKVCDLFGLSLDAVFAPDDAPVERAATRVPQPVVEHAAPIRPGDPLEYANKRPDAFEDKSGWLVRSLKVDDLSCFRTGLVR